ncbi:MAG: hypothetical protein IJM59_09055 [Proteobacteria bacterium]|nr:hypothetical protein [Pseudomonadota bacterium]
MNYQQMLIFDIGSNATKASLFINNKIIRDWRVSTKLGKDTHPDGSISHDAIARQISAIEQIIAEARKITHSPAAPFLMHALGTQALRKAPNRSVIVELFQKNFGLTLEIISEQREAELEKIAILHSGARRNHPDKRILSLDSGGSSTEYVLLRPDGLVFRQDSYPFGQHDIRNAIEHDLPMPFIGMFCDLEELCRQFPPELIITAGSSFTTYAGYALRIIPYRADLIESRQIQPDCFYPPEDMAAACGSRMVSDLAARFSAPIFTTTLGIRHGWIASQNYCSSF